MFGGLFKKLAGRRREAAKTAQFNVPAPINWEDPEPYSLKKGPFMPVMAEDKYLFTWFKDQNDQYGVGKADEFAQKRLEADLQNPQFVDREFEKLVTSRGSDPQTLKAMMSIAQNTKVALLRQAHKAQSGPQFPSVEQHTLDEDKENAIVQPYKDAGLLIPDPSSSLDADKPLKRKRSSISLRRVKSFSSIKRTKVLSVLRRNSKEHNKDDDSKSSHSSIAVSETGIEEPARPRSAGESIKGFFTGARNRRSIDSKPVDTLPVIAKDDGETDIPAHIPSSTPHPLASTTIKGDKGDVKIALSKPAPTWNSKDDVIANQLPWPAQQFAQIDNFVRTIHFMRDFFTPGLEPDAESLGCLDFEEPLRQLLMFVRCEGSVIVKKFADDAMQPLIETVTVLANKEFRPLHETKTLRALLSILLALIKLPWCLGMKFVKDDKTDKSLALGTCVYIENTVEFDNMFKALIEMKFSHGEERRGFSNFRDRRLVIEVMSAWVKAPNNIAGTQEARAKRCLEYFKDPADTKNHDFIQAMKVSRPYTRWYQELSYSTQGFGGVGWIWHNKGNQLRLRDVSKDTSFSSYYQEFKPIDVPKPDETCSTVRSHTETLVTCYIAATIDFMTVLVASLPNKTDRMAYRDVFRRSRFNELFLSRFLRASNTNFPIVHTALSTWYTAAKADGEEIN